MQTPKYLKVAEVPRVSNMLQDWLLQVWLGRWQPGASPWQPGAFTPKDDHSTEFSLTFKLGANTSYVLLKDHYIKAETTRTQHCQQL